MENTRNCSFCEQKPNPEEGRVLLETAKVAICNECVERCTKQLEALGIFHTTSEATSFVEEVVKLAKKPSDIVAFLDDYVVGQDKAKRILAVGIVNHYKMLEHKASEASDVEIQKSNIIMVGPTGSGKTYVLKQIAKVLDVPFAQADATSLTEAGYVGEDVENVLRKLIEAADGDLDAAERGIIYIDEIDKLSRKGENLSITRDVSGEGVQQALLKLIEGAEVEVAEKGMRKHPMADTMKLNTENILFIVGGSFEGIEKTIAKRMKEDTSSIGFGAKVESKTKVEFNDYILEIKQEDLKKFGMLPELLGRLPIIAPLQELDRDALVQIITGPKNAILKQYQELFKFDGIELEFTQDGVDAVADLAIERKTGARSLRSIMEEVLIDYMYKLPDMDGVEKITFDAKAVKKEASPEIYYKQNDAS